ncbi:MAG: PhnD/SsuA/transferrin family substrate-binding protein [Notoacmeibacter sp.]|nr:PhnD/SsuA/transferrin family substrate-binding protein [Notoacmeibacter sp.]MCC0032268.1 PhnD/SsuA/transferrin family substrate-binding protein [Brucellaceae bacterium]
MTSLLRRMRRLLAGTLLAATVAAPALADWRTDIGTFRIGLVSPSGERALPGLELVRETFSQTLRMPVEIFVAKDYPALVDAQASGRIEYAVYSALAYAAAARLCECVEPLAAPVGQDGATGLRAVLLLRSGLPGGEVPEVAVAAVQLSLAGPAAFLGKGPDVPKFRPRAVATAEEAEALFAAGQADGMVGWLATDAAGDKDASGTVARLDALGQATTARTIAWRGPVLAFGPHAVRRSLDPQARKALAAMLTGLAATKPDVLEALSPRHPGGFRPVAPIDYASASEALQALLEAE